MVKKLSWKSSKFLQRFRIKNLPEDPYFDVKCNSSQTNFEIENVF